MLGDMQKAKETGPVCRSEAVKKRGKTTIGCLNKSYLVRGKTKVIITKEQ